MASAPFSSLVKGKWVTTSHKFTDKLTSPLIHLSPFSFCHIWSGYVSHIYILLWLFYVVPRRDISDIKCTPSKIYAFAMFRKNEISFFVKSWLHEIRNFKRIRSDTKHINHSSVCDDVVQYSDLTVLLSLFLQNIPSYCVWTRCKHLILVDTSHIM